MWLCTVCFVGRACGARNLKLREKKKQIFTKYHLIVSRKKNCYNFVCESETRTKKKAVWDDEKKSVFSWSDS